MLYSWTEHVLFRRESGSGVAIKRVEAKHLLHGFGQE